ncbi:MAG: hypothetical protein M4579_000431 [Chaenotheca gracillima]|nr:MAG: hypothetical protein M4579_000431 [Chaenotheca gracillima]
MSTIGRRHRSSTAASTSAVSAQLSAELEPLIKLVDDDVSRKGEAESIDDVLQLKSHALHRIRQSLIDSQNQNQAKDAFRHLHGFQAVLTGLRRFSGQYDPVVLSRAAKTHFFELVKISMAVLSDAMSGHSGNKRYFTKRVEGGGWLALEQTLASTGIGGAGADWASRDEDGQEQFFGCLFAFALGEETSSSLFTSTRRYLETKLPQLEKDIDPAGTPNTPEETTSEPGRTTKQDAIGLIQIRLQDTVGQAELLRNPEVFGTMFRFWTSLRGNDRLQNTWSDRFSATILLAMHQVAVSSQYNLVAFHGTGILSTMIPFLLHGSMPPQDVSLLQQLCDVLISLGVPNLEDAALMYRKAVRNPDAAEFLLRAIQSSHGPAHFQFDLSIHGHSSVEISTLGRPFPPQTSSDGYSLALWMYIDEFDPNCHTTLFGAFDATQTCFVLAYLEKDTRNFILQTSVTSSRPSVRFKSVVFKKHRWYHVALVHHRPRTTTSSKATLYVNGIFSEQVKCQYPQNAPNLNSSTDSFASLSSSSKPSSVQAFLGTPQDLSSRLGKGLVSSCWSLVSFHLFEDALSPDLIAVYYHLGLRYSGNFQDCLGSFQTYQNSAALMIRNEMMHPETHEKSEIVSAIKYKAGNLLPESRILLSISPNNVLRDEDLSNVHGSQLVKCLSRTASQNLQRYTRSGTNAVVINGAIPSINEALCQASGTAILIGEPVVVIPAPLDDSYWQLAGCASIGLKMVEMSNTQEDVVRSVQIFLESVRESWRNSEAVEKENAFSVLGYLLRGKMGVGAVIVSSEGRECGPIEGGMKECEKLGFELLSLILGFVGYRHEKPEESIIINPLAYRMLLIDTDMWRKTAVVTQKQYYKQFITFVITSKNQAFNTKRLLRMRVVKKFLDALKGEEFYPETFPNFMEAFRALVARNMSAEVLRSLALFVTYTLHKSNSGPARPLRSSKSVARIRRRPTNSPARSEASTPKIRSASELTALGKELSPKQIGLSMLELYCDLLCNEEDSIPIKKFARSVTNKWILYLLAENDPKIIACAVRILSRLLTTHGPSYVAKFVSKTGGFTIMKQQLKKWWRVQSLWLALFSILFNRDVSQMDFARPFELFSLLDMFLNDGMVKVVYPEVLPVLIAMLGDGMRALVKGQGETEESLSQQSPSPNGTARKNATDLQNPGNSSRSQEHLTEEASIIGTVTRFLTDIHSKSQSFRDFAVSSTYVQELLFILLPIVVTSDTVSAETELRSRDSALTFEGEDVMIKPLSHASNRIVPVVRTTSMEPPPSPSAQRARPLRRGSSFVLVSSDNEQGSHPSAMLKPLLSSQRSVDAALRLTNSTVQGVLEMVMAIFTDQIFERKEFPGFGLFLKVPPGFQEHQAYFETWVLRNTLSHLRNTAQLNRKLLWEPRVLTNLARCVAHLGEAVFEGWFLNGAEALLDFAGDILDYLQKPDVAAIKSVRLCSQATASIRSVFLRTTLLRLSEYDENEAEENGTLRFLGKMMYWQTIFLSREVTETNFLLLMCYLLYTRVIGTHQKLQHASLDLLRIILVQKPAEVSGILRDAKSTGSLDVGAEFTQLTRLDNQTFADWITQHRDELDPCFLTTMAKSWEDFVETENRKTQESADRRVNRRKEKLKVWSSEDAANEITMHRHEISSRHWMVNIHASEHLKYQRAMQDHQDNLQFIESTFTRLEQELTRPQGLLDNGDAPKWRLDETEGRNRQRLRIVRDNSIVQDQYQPKRKRAEALLAKSAPNTQTNLPTTQDSNEITSPIANNSITDEVTVSRDRASSMGQSTEESADGEEEFELVDDPHDDDGYEDKNRKVMRSLQRGDQVHHLYNVSRIVGLEACEGLLILGNEYMYLSDGFLQRLDGEIVNAWQAAKEERDPYMQMISGRESSKRHPQLQNEEHESRSWRWDDLLSVSKRRFLFRDVALEVFFTDGRSYLLTAKTAALRDELHARLIAKAPHAGGASPSTRPEDSWRVEALKSSEDVPQTLGYKFASVFGSAGSNPATRKWVKGEISNFHYLMLINTMAGRTFNDLTQYPVFPWVLADYTSEELDLSDPRSFRDLSKPMGCQNPEREAEFRDRYRSFAEMGDHNAPPFHYGTHYSSAMIVTSYLIRMQPFVQSYLLLQGGAFDHADRLFYSMDRAWQSASRDNMTDVRELIPEFFYLPDFLENANGFDFGTRQGSGERIDSVALPPWAKGDPKIFIAKHREALESPHVSKNLHQWIDLVFGFKQRGEAALEATNMFHHLSYHGAKDLDNIEDPVERLATIGIIHNFGQTPHQIFQRGHPAREAAHHKFKRLDTAAESLTKLPFPLLERGESVTSLLFLAKQDRLLCSAAFRLNIPPNHDKYMEWGFVDDSVRFYLAEGKKLVGLFEHLHQGQLSCALFADSRTLITAGMDCVISLWAVVSYPKAVDLQTKASLFGHRTPVTTLAVSRSFSAFLSASTDGQVLLWDLNRLEFVRKIASGRLVECARINDITGNIMLCRGRKVSLYSLNGEMLVEQDVCNGNDDHVVSCAFYEGTGNEWLERELLFTGHRHGVVNIWNKSISPQTGKFQLQLVHRLNHADPARSGPDGLSLSSSITCILPLAQVVYTGDEDGRVVSLPLLMY